MKKKLLLLLVAVLLVAVLTLWCFAEDVYFPHIDDTAGQVVSTVELTSIDYPEMIKIDGKQIGTEIVSSSGRSRTQVTLTGVYAKCSFGGVINVIKTDYVVRVLDETGNLYWVWATNLGFEY